MAKLTSMFKFEGKLDGFSAYRTEDGHLIRKAGGGSKDQFNNSPTMERTRENASEFGRAASAGKLLRTSLRVLIQNAQDSKLTSRLTKDMLAIVKADSTSVRGQRGILDAEVEALKGFEFNEGAKLASTVFMPLTPTINRASGAHAINVPAYVPLNTLAAPRGTTHFKLIAGAVSVDFEQDVYEVVTAQSGNLVMGAQNEAASSLALALSAASTHPILLALGIEFYQQVNGQFYSLQNGAFNALAVVEVDGAV